MVHKFRVRFQLIAKIEDEIQNNRYISEYRYSILQFKIYCYRVYTMSMYPIPILPTYMGHLLYSPSDIHNERCIPSYCGTIDVGDVIGKDFGDRQVSEVMKVPQNIEYVFSFRSVFGPAVNCDSSGISVQSRSGRKKITIENYLQRALVDKPSILVALADEVSFHIMIKPKVLPL